MRKERWRWSVILFLMLAGLFWPVKVHAEETDSYLDGLSDEMDYGKLDTFLKDYGVELVSFSGLVEELMQDGGKHSVGRTCVFCDKNITRWGDSS